MHGFITHMKLRRRGNGRVILKLQSSDEEVTDDR